MALMRKSFLAPSVKPDKVKDVWLQYLPFFQLPLSSNFNVVNDSKKGVIILTWERVEGAITYAFEELEDNGSWKNGRYCNQTSMTLSGFTLGARKLFRIKAIGPDTKTSEWSEPVEVWIS